MEGRSKRSSFSHSQNNIITTKLSHSLKIVNAFTNNFLAENLSESISQFNEVSINQDTHTELVKLQDSFQELYYIVGAQHEADIKVAKTDKKKNVKRTGRNDKGKLPSVSSAKLREILSNVKDLRVGSSSGSQESQLLNSIADPLSNFISLYSLIIIYSRVTDILIASTVSSNEDLLYWNKLNESQLSKLLYLLQISPQRLYELGRTILYDFKERVMAKEDTCFSDRVITQSNGEDWQSPTEEDNELYHFMNRTYRAIKLLSISTTNTIAKLLDSLSMPSYLFLQLNKNDHKSATLISQTSIAGSGKAVSSKDASPETKYREFLSKSAQSLGLYTRIILGAPMRSINFEIGEKRSIINDKIDTTAYNLGSLITKLPGKDFNEIDAIKKFIVTGHDTAIFKVVDSIESILKVDTSKATKSLNERLFDVTVKIDEFQTSTKGNVKTAPPSFLVRHWPILLLLFQYGPKTSFDIYTNRYVIYEWVKLNLVDTVNGFLKDWLIKPITDMLSVIRHDDASTELSITTKESLQSDLDSLERMVVDYAIDYESSQLTNTDINAFKTEIHQAVKDGDLTILMSKYEQDIRTPLKSIVKGSLPRALLIQLQKTKVDGAVAINGIDKLLKSQQLVFAMVSISPSIFIVYQLWQVAKRQIYNKPLFVNGKQVNLICLKSLNNIEKYLQIYTEVSEDQRIYIEGYLLIEVLNLKRQSLKILPKNIQEMWIKDLNDLNDDEWSIEGRLRTISRIWSVYGHYFR